MSRIYAGLLVKGRNIEKKQILKNRIIEVAWELFEEKGYEATTMNDIIEKHIDHELLGIWKISFARTLLWMCNYQKQ